MHPAFRCRELSWPFFSSRLVLLLALRILHRIFPCNYVRSCTSFVLHSFASLLGSSILAVYAGNLNLLLRPFCVISHFMRTCTFYITLFIQHFATLLSPGKQFLLLLLYLELFTAFFSPVGYGFCVCLLTASVSFKFKIFSLLHSVILRGFVLCLLVCSRLVYLAYSSCSRSATFNLNGNVVANILAEYYSSLKEDALSNPDCTGRRLLHLETSLKKLQTEVFL